MQRLVPGRVAELKRSVADWQTPEAMGSIVDPIPSDVLFNQAGLEFLRDASVASMFGRVRQVEHVRCVDDLWPDLELRSNGIVERFEAVEVLDPERRRGDEYRNISGELVHISMDKMIADAEAAPSWIAAACRKKVDKRYAGCANLIIYMNISEFGFRDDEFRRSLLTATEESRKIASDRFGRSGNIRLT